MSDIRGKGSVGRATEGRGEGVRGGIRGGGRGVCGRDVKVRGEGELLCTSSVHLSAAQQVKCVCPE